MFMDGYANFVDAENGYCSPLGAPLQSENWPHDEKMSIFQSLLYFYHNITAGKETSY